MKRNASIWMKLIFVLCLMLSSVSMPAPLQARADERENIALNKEVSASRTDYDRGPQLAVDGNKSNATFWDGGSFGNYMTVDLGDLYDLEEIVVYTYWDGSRYYHYDLMVSADGTTFETITTKEDEAISTEDGDAYAYDDVAARYVRIQINYNSSPWGNIQLCELEVYGSLHQRTDEEDILRDKALSSCADGSEITALTDDRLDTAEAVDKRLDVCADLGRWHSLEEIRIDAAAAHDAGYIIRGSKDGSNCKEICHGTLDAGENTIQIDAYQGQYLKISFRGEAEIQEISVYGSPVQKPDPGINLAKGKQAEASATANGMPASYAVDGNVNSYWDGGSTGQYLTVDLGADYALSQIKVITYFGDERYYKYVVSTSLDNVTFTPIYTKWDETLSTSEGISFAPEDVTARYVRVTILENSSPWGSVHLNELEVYGTQSDHEEENIAAGKTVSASGTAQGYQAAAAIDDDYQSAWKGASASDTLSIDLGETHRLDHLVFFTEGLTNSLVTFRL